MKSIIPEEDQKKIKFRVERRIVIGDDNDFYIKDLFGYDEESEALAHIDCLERMNIPFVYFYALDIKKYMLQGFPEIVYLKNPKSLEED